MHGGAPEVIEFVRRRESAWRWWDNPDIQRPLVSLVAIKPADEFETARPDQGVTLRVRCSFENTAQGRPKKAITELVKLILDGTEVVPRLVARPQPRTAAYGDHYHEFHISHPSPGKHSATAVFRAVETHAISSRTVDFAL